MKKLSLPDVAALAIWLLPLLYLASIYAHLPARIPLHFGMDGKPNQYGSLHEFLYPVFLLCGVSLGIYLLLRFLPFVDPKLKAKYSSELFKKLGFGLVLFMAAINLALMYAAMHQGLEMRKIVFPITGIFFTFLGNIMNSLKPNYFVGIRTPWTLESEPTWRKTHQLAGKLWLAGGIVITAATLLLPPNVAIYLFVAILLIITLIPMVYSYVYFKKQP